MMMANIHSSPEPSEIIQLLDEHHLVVLEDRNSMRFDFMRTLRDSLDAMPSTELITIDGRRATDLTSFCHEFTRQRHDIDEPCGSIDTLIERFRDWPGEPHHRYLLWNDADVLLDADIDVFGRIINALCLVAAAFEHLESESLVLHRFVLIGGSKLGAYAEDVRGQLNAWREEDPEAEPLLMQIQPIMPRPSFLVYRLDG